MMSDFGEMPDFWEMPRFSEIPHSDGELRSELEAILELHRTVINGSAEEAAIAAPQLLQRSRELFRALVRPAAPICDAGTESEDYKDLQRDGIRAKVAHTKRHGFLGPDELEEMICDVLEDANDGQIHWMLQATPHRRGGQHAQAQLAIFLYREVELVRGRKDREILDQINASIGVEQKEIKDRWRAKLEARFGTQRISKLLQAARRIGGRHELSAENASDLFCRWDVEARIAGGREEISSKYKAAIETIKRDVAARESPKAKRYIKG